MKVEKCPICGSINIKMLDETSLRSHFHCDACDHDFYSLKKEIVDKQIRKELTPEEIFKKNVDSVVIVGIANRSGTGFVIDNHYIVSNAHIFYPKDKKLDPEAKPYYSLYKSYKKIKAKNIYRSKEVDMVILEVEEYLPQSVTISTRDIAVGEHCYAVGNTKGLGIAMTDGIVSDNHRLYKGQDFILSSALISGGNSGGPLFDQYGELIGINTLSYEDAVGMNLAIDKSLVLKTIDEIKANIK